jgi:hypothetical protein
MYIDARDNHQLMMRGDGLWRGTQEAWTISRRADAAPEVLWLRAHARGGAVERTCDVDEERSAAQGV